MLRAEFQQVIQDDETLNKHNEEKEYYLRALKTPREMQAYLQQTY